MMAPETMPALIDWFEASFVCFQGPKSAYFEIQSGEHEIFRGIYSTYRVGTSATDIEAEKRLVAWMFNQFTPFSNQYLALFWRLPEKIELTYRSAPALGEMVATDEQVQDGLMPPTGCIRDPASGVWRLPVTEKARLDLRTRLIIPALAWSVLPLPQATAEGATRVMI